MENATMSFEEVAVHLGTSYMTVRRLVQRGELRAIRIGKGWRVDRKSLDKFIEVNTGQEARQKGK